MGPARVSVDPWPLVRRFVFAREPEAAHDMALRALELGAIRPTKRAQRPRPSLARTVAGLRFANPIGIAAGFDKDGRVPLQILGQGFGFTEVGTTTPKPQAGNPKPRVFRLLGDDALINRLGFNNAGHDAMAQRLERLPGKGARPGVLGVNIGANKQAEDRIADYTLGVRRFAGLADYITINISSPNTPGLRDLQGKEALQRLLAEALDAREQMLSAGAACPIFVKIAPDLDEAGLADTLSVLEASSVEGVIVSNTTNARPSDLRSPQRTETGGLSGKPLFERSTALLRTVRERLGTQKALIGVGGVDSAQTARAKLDAGADLVQLYTGYVFKGPGLIGDILDGLDSAGRSA
ncbi:MAG: quinone-dependent dihydroorotate dehydrogenase [Devosiaceae bacterium]|nr:quinone-dependent dihydroorotate dehydrogenase [Devosiaceae bacterium MH13]